LVDWRQILWGLMVSSPFIALYCVAMWRYNMPYCYYIYGAAGSWVFMCLVKFLFLGPPKPKYSSVLTQKEEEAVNMATD